VPSRTRAAAPRHVDRFGLPDLALAEIVVLKGPANVLCHQCVPARTPWPGTPRVSSTSAACLRTRPQSMASCRVVSTTSSLASSSAAVNSTRVAIGHRRISAGGWPRRPQA